MEDGEIVVQTDVDPKETTTAIAVLQAKVHLITRMMVTKHEFAPVKMIAYGLAGAIISSVLFAVLSYVIKKS